MRVILRMFISLIISAFFLFSCEKTNYFETGYSAYKPILMTRSQLEESVSKQDAKDIDTVFKVEIWKNYLLIGEIYKGIHVLDNSQPTNPVAINFISIPGIIDFAIKDSVIYANNAVDLVAIDLFSGEVLDRERDVFPELLPPDGLQPNPRFMRGLRPDSTEIIAWTKDENYNEDSVTIIPNYLLGIRENFLYGLIGPSLIIFDIRSGIPQYRSLQKVNYNFNYRMKLLSDYGLFFSQSNMEVYSFLSNDSLVYQNEYTGINFTNYFDVRHTVQGYYLAVTYHYFPLYWNLSNQLEIYYVGDFDRVVLDTIIRLSYPLDVHFKDSLLLVCDGGIKIFKTDSTYHLVNYIPSDAQKIYIRDSLLVSIGEQVINQYYIHEDSLRLLSSLPISMSWVIK